MAYNTVGILVDKDGNPISQYYNPSTGHYEPIEGASGANRVILYNEDGTENNSLSLLPILTKLSELTGTVIDEATRKSNELQRISLYDEIAEMLIDGDLKGDTGNGLLFNWDDTKLGIKVEGDASYVYVNLKGEQGVQGIQGETGKTGSIANLTSTHVIDALGYTPIDEDRVLTDVPEDALFTDTKYTHPTNHPPSIITQDASNRFVTDTEKTGWTGKADKKTTFTATLLASNWVGSVAPYTQTVNVTGMLATMNPFADIILSSTVETAIAEAEAWGLIGKLETLVGQIKATCLEEKPTVNINITLVEVK